MQKTVAKTTASTVTIYTQIMPKLMAEQNSARNLLIASNAPDNPNTQNICQLTLRSHELEMTYLTLFDLDNGLTGAEFSLCDNKHSVSVCIQPNTPLKFCLMMRAFTLHHY